MQKRSPTHKGSDLEKEVTGCLQEFFKDLESGHPEHWHADPYFEREPEITQAVADRLIAALDEEYSKEIDSYSDYHHRRSGANAKPEFHRAPPVARLGLAQRLVRIIDRYD